MPGSAFKTANDKTHEVWIFDTGASFDITADLFHLLDSIRCYIVLSVGGGVSLHATHMRSVHLYIEIGGSVLPVTLSDVLYVPDGNEARLISWRKIYMLGHFQMVGEDGIITVLHKSDYSPLFIAALKYVCLRVLPLARHDTTRTAATDFSQHALVHSSICFCSTATDIYTDGSMISKRPTEFFCPACAKYNSKHAVTAPVSNPQYKNPFYLIHSDLLVPLVVEFLGSHKYMLSLVEDQTPYSEVNVLHIKPDAPCLIKVFWQKVDTQTLRYI